MLVDGHEEVETLNECVSKSFERDTESDNIILSQDRMWAKNVGLELHPSIVINGRVYYGDVNGKELAYAICGAYKEAPDECELSWKISVLKDGIVEDMNDMRIPELANDYLKNEAEESRSGTKNFQVGNQQIEKPPARMSNNAVQYNSKEIYAVVTVVVLINIVILVLYRRRLKKQ